MTINVSQAITAYAQAAAKGAKAAGSADAGQVGDGFAALVARATGDAVQAGRHSESVSLQAVANQAELNEIVTAVTNAEVTLQTVVAIRDRVIQAYQEIIRMPI